jgi:hypothetical protein
MPSRFVELADAAVDAGFIETVRTATAARAVGILSSTSQLHAGGTACAGAVARHFCWPHGTSLVFLIGSLFCLAAHAVLVHLVARRIVRQYGHSTRSGD